MHKNNYIKIEGKKFGRWVVLKKGPPRPSRDTYFYCKCECGTKRLVRGVNLRLGRTLSCGCLCLEINTKRLKGNQLGFKHGYNGHPLRSIWKAMLHRCNNKNNRFFSNYGGRGIKVHDKWKESKVEFIEWALENGWEKGLSIDRIDNDGNYTPQNCRWITISENSKRKRTTWKGKLKKK